MPYYLSVFSLLKYGAIEEMNVCDNLGDHLVGNVYIKVNMFVRVRMCVCMYSQTSIVQTSNIRALSSTRQVILQLHGPNGIEQET